MKLLLTILLALTLTSCASLGGVPSKETVEQNQLVDDMQQSWSITYHNNM